MSETEDGQTVFAGYSFDIRRLAWYDWVVVLLTTPLGGFGLGWGLVVAAEPVDDD
jgi:hypothetical protein